MSKDTTVTDSPSAEKAEQGRASSYGSILKSSSIVGGGEVINYGVGLLRTKAVALLLGPSGIGLLGLYNNLQQALVTFAGAGVSFSGVREIAKGGEGVPSEITARVAHAVRRISLLLGLLGALAVVVLARPLSDWVFEDSTRAPSVALLGVAVCLLVVSGGQKALVQGCRRIGDLARIQVLSALLSTLLAVGLYAWLGQEGILPVFILTACCNLSLTWHFSRKIELVATQVSWKEVFVEAKPLLGLGLAFMWSMLLMSLVDLFIRSFILRELGLESVGIYQAAWAISGLFASFILNAMGADFYPRLTAVESDHSEMVRLINEQTEIGILLALPGILGTLAFAPWVMTLLYSAKFTIGADLLPWLVLGVFGRVVTWPMGFVFLAKGAKGHFAAIETVMKIPRVLFVIFLVKQWGLVGAAVAWPINYVIYFCIVYPLTHRMIGFRYQRASVLLFLKASCLIVLSFLSVSLLPQVWGTSLAVLALCLGTLFSLRSLLQCLDAEHRIVRMIRKLPLMG